MFKLLLTAFVFFAFQSSRARLSSLDILKIENRLIDIYQPLEKNKNAKIKFLNLWSSQEANAFSRWIPEVNTRFIEIHGALLAHQSLTEAGFVFLICHELGHQFGGAPFIHPKVEISNEGQADYFAGLDCAKRYFLKFKNDAIVIHKNDSNFYKKLCTQTNVSHIKLCIRVIRAGHNFLETLNSFETKKQFMSLSLKSNFKTPETISGFSYPSYQCRLDTVIAAGLCADLPLENKLLTGCKDNSLSARPSCWYFSKP